MKDTLMVATDLSPDSELAVERAVQLALQRGLDLWLLHVIDFGPRPTVRGGSTSSPEADEEAMAARRRLLEMAEGIENRSALRVRTETPVGPASRRIAEFAATHRPGLLAVGERGRNWVRHTVLLGGTALEVVEKAEVPVLLVRRPPTTDYSRVVAATDFSAPSARAARLARDFFPVAELTLVHAYAAKVEEQVGYGSDSELASSPVREEESGHARQRMEDFVAATGIGQEHAPGKRLIFGYPAQAILATAAECRADLVVVGRHGGSPVGERLLGSVTQSVLYNARCDVMIVP